MPDIASWLTRLGLDKYVRVFIENEIDLDALRHLSEDDLKELGLPVGPRRKVLAAIAVLVDDSLSQSSSQVIPAPVPPRSEASGGSSR
jgi:SAM (Sterile alpha motif) domain-containing protein